jgi:putative drug exporter of the RND superfamily
MEWLATRTIRYRRSILVTAAVVFVLCAAIGGNVSHQLNSGGFDDPNSQSAGAERILQDTFHTGAPNLVLLVRARSGTVDDPAVAASAQALTAKLAADPDLEGVASYWTLGSAAPFKSRDGKEALVFGRIQGTEDQVRERAATFMKDLGQGDANISVGVTGTSAVERQVGDTIEADLTKAESIVLPLTLVLLVVVFGSLVAGMLPVAIGAMTVLGTFAALRILLLFTHVSIFSLNLTTALGLGLAIDYSLFVLSRFREEQAKGHPLETALVRSMRAAGRTVLFSGFTVAVSMSALLIFPQFFLRSFAYAGIAVVGIALLSTLVLLPAMVAALGPRLDRGKVFRNRPAVAPDDGFWHRLATVVMRRPVPVAAAVIVVLVALGSPFLHVAAGQPDQRVLPSGASTRATLDHISADFDSNEANAFPVVAPDAGGNVDDPAVGQRVDAYAKALSGLGDVTRVDTVSGSYVDGQLVQPASTLLQQRFGHGSGVWFSVVPSQAVQPSSPAGEHLVHAIRDLQAPFPVKVGGQPADLVDSKQAIAGRIPLALGIIAAVTFVTLLLTFGSLLVPVKAVVLNLLSLSAVFGAMVWIFQDGHGAGLLHFTPTGALDTSTPILMFCIAFGLSMDYEVFLLSRIKEEHDRGADTVTSVARGLERTGRIVTAAAALMAVVFLSFATSRVEIVKLFGLGLTLAVLMDATLIRGLLVPALMRMAGRANWWAPAPIQRLSARLGLGETEALDVTGHDELATVPTPVPVLAGVVVSVDDGGDSADSVDSAGSQGTGGADADRALR